MYAPDEHHHPLELDLRCLTHAEKSLSDPGEASTVRVTGITIVGHVDCGLTGARTAGTADPKPKLWPISISKSSIRSRRLSIADIRPSSCPSRSSIFSPSLVFTKSTFSSTETKFWSNLYCISFRLASIALIRVSIIVRSESGGSCICTLTSACMALCLRAVKPPCFVSQASQMKTPLPDSESVDHSHH